MGPTCEVLLHSDKLYVLDAIDACLVSLCLEVNRTRKGRVWDVLVDGCPVHIAIAAGPPAIELSAGCNRTEDLAALRKLASALAIATTGEASDPMK